MVRRRACAVAAALAAALLLGSGAHAGADEAVVDAEDVLARWFAPAVELVDQPEPCGPGEPYQPTDVSAVLGRDDVALRGPWTTDDLVKVAPEGDDLAAGLPGYHLDLPGDPLRPGCSYEQWSDLVTAGTAPTVYAHVAREADHPGRLALQYWLYYPFNDYNNKHESDWEMVQLEFATDDPAAAVRTGPERLVYSQHEGAEVADWGAARVELVDDRHPVVRPAAGSHANYFADALYLGRSASQGFGCDDARGPASTVLPDVQVVPSDPDEAAAAYPWIAYEGHWGQREDSFYNGPTGPNTKTQWTRPFTWSDEEGRERSYAVPASGLFGTGATDLFCSGVSAGSDAFRVLTADPLVAVGALVAVVLALWGLSRLTAWRPSTPLRLVRRRTIGQVLTASLRMYGSRWRLFTVLGLVAVPAAALGSWAGQVGQTVGGTSLTDTSAPTVGPVLLGLAGSLVSGLAGLFVQSSSMAAVAQVDDGSGATARSAMRRAVRRLPAVVGAAALYFGALVVLFISVLMAPVALALAVLGALWLPVVTLEGRGPLASLRRSAALVRRRVVPVVLLIALANLLVSATGPLVGFGVLLLGDVPVAVGNAVAGLVYALLSPLVGVVTVYVFADGVVRHTEHRSEAVEVLPAEGELSTP